MRKSGSLWLYFFVLSVLFLPIGFILFRNFQYTHGVFMYPFDDTFIHLTIADNLLKGDWGINQNEFASASSSILYTLILAAFRLVSKSATVPFVVNVIAGLIILISLHLWLKKHLISYVGQGAIILLAIFFAPLPLLIISGMEHTLQCLFSFLFIFYFSDWLEHSNNSGQKNLPFKIFLFAVLVSSIRYEGLFLIAVACLLLVAYKNFFTAIILGLVSLIPIIVFGLISVSHGNYFLPNSVLVKSGSFEYSNLLQKLYEILFDKLFYARNGMAALATQRLLIILPLLYLVFKKHLRPAYFFILVFLFVATVCQLSFASTGYMYRYEAYLFFCFMTILPVIFYKYGRQILLQLDSFVSKIIALAIAFFLIFPIVLRSTTALNKTSQACINIYDQQYQMAAFTKKYYDRNTIALNDIGAIGYYTNAKIIDLWGLANITVTRSKKEHYWTPEFLDSLCRTNKVQIAIIYDAWFPGLLTNKWNKAATWQIQNNVICGDSIVSFYALDPSSRNMLQQRLREFEPQLPSSVLVRYY